MYLIAMVFNSMLHVFAEKLKIARFDQLHDNNNHLASTFRPSHAWDQYHGDIFIAAEQ
jgi:hypothetical protein